MPESAIKLLRPEEDAIEAIAQLVAAAALRRMKRKSAVDPAKEINGAKDDDNDKKTDTPI